MLFRSVGGTAQLRGVAGGKGLYVNSSGCVGIGVTAPTTRLQVVPPNSSDNIMSLGTASGVFSVMTSTNAYGLFIGVKNNNGDVWLQSGRSDGDASAYNILLNPAGGNVGIGSTSPQQKLDVNGIVNATDFYKNGSAFTGSQWTTSGADIYYNTGNVGIGTTAPIGTTTDFVSGSTRVQMDIAGGSIHLANGNGIYIGDESTNIVGGAHFSYSATTNAISIAGIKQNVDYASILLNSSGGSVGIGTTVAGTKLHVYERGNVENILRLQTQAADNTVQFYSHNGTAPYVTGQIKVYRSGASNEASELRISTAQATTGVLTARLNINNQGNVGIGTTVPGQKLHVYGSGATSQILVDTSSGSFDPSIALTTAGATNEGLKLWYDANVGSVYFDTVLNAANADIHFRTKTAGTPVEAMFIQSTGNVGIGTTSPTSKLVVNGAANDTISSAKAISKIGWLIDKGGVSLNFGGLDGTPNYGAWIQAARSTDDLAFQLLLNPLGGSVGIGTTVPAYKLDVQGGAINASGGIYNNGTLVNGSQWTTNGTNIGYTTGCVGIGTTSPRTTLEVSGDISTDWNDRFIGTTYWGTSKAYRYGIETHKDDRGVSLIAYNEDSPIYSGYIDFKIGKWSSPRVAMTINKDGNVGIGTTAPNSRLQINGSFAVYRTSTDVSASSAGQTIIGVTDTASARTITLASADCVAGRIVIIKDESGSAGTNNITVATEGAQAIDGITDDTSVKITANYGVLRLYSNGTNWFTF